MIRNILLHVDDDPRHGQRLDLAIRLALQHEAHLTGLLPIMPPQIPAFAEVPIGPEFFERELAALRERAAVLAAEFEKETDRQGVPAEWRCEEGDPIRLMIRHGRYADLVMLPRESAGWKEAAAYLMGEMVMGMGRPVLIVPSAGRFTTIGGRVLVAWNGSREATRAVHDALPILRRADSVIVLSVNPPDAASHMPGADISAHLAAHGVTVTAQRSIAPDIEVGDVLLNAVADEGADLLVMGAYGHTRLRELVLGGVSRHILMHMTVPVLMSH